jgi:cytochrome b561
MDTPKRYHFSMVILHWLTVVLMLGAGFLAGDEGGSSAPIDIHIILGGLLLVVLVIRLVLRFTTQRPAWASTGNAYLNKFGELVHVGLYFFAIFILVWGAVIAYQRNLFAYVLGTGAVSFERVNFLIRGFHHLGWVAILGLLLLHVGGALYHQFILKDKLFDRMWFGSN